MCGTPGVTEGNKQGTGCRSANTSPLMYCDWYFMCRYEFLDVPYRPVKLYKIGQPVLCLRHSITAKQKKTTLLSLQTLQDSALP